MSEAATAKTYLYIAGIGGVLPSTEAYDVLRDRIEAARAIPMSDGARIENPYGTPLVQTEAIMQDSEEGEQRLARVAFSAVAVTMIYEAQ